MAQGATLYANSNVAHFVNAAAFSTPPAVTSVGQTSLAPLGGGPTQALGPAFHRLDLSLFKSFPIREGVSVELRAECFNFSNTPNFANPTLLNYQDSTSFGRLTATRDSPNDPREFNSD
jgi:hypothetical protein